MPKIDDEVHHTQTRVTSILWTILILSTSFICYFRNLGTIGLVGPDEPRYAWIARDMAESGDWITPRLYGQPWFEKPVLYYWGAALSFKLFGVNEVAARLPSAFCALLATLAMAWLAWRVYGAETARWLLLLMPPTVGMLGFSHAAAPDMPFAATLSLALVCAATILGLTRSSGDMPILPRTPWLALILFGFFLGLAVLAKGPAAIILIGGGVLLWATFPSSFVIPSEARNPSSIPTSSEGAAVIPSEARNLSSIPTTSDISLPNSRQPNRWRDILRLLHPIALASFCATALPWYILCAQRNPDFFRVFIIEHNFKRYLTPEFQHIQPFWYYVPILLIAFAPWTLALLWSAAFGIANCLQARRLTPLTVLLLCWSVFCVAFFSISQSKLPGYILPAVPALALLLAQSYSRLLLTKPPFQWLQFGFSLIAIAAGFFLLGILGKSYLPSRISPAASASIGFLLLGFALANLLFSLHQTYVVSGFSFSALCVLPVLILSLLFPQLAEPFLRYDPSGRTLARQLQEHQTPLDELYIERMNRGQEYSLNFYLHREVKHWDEKHPQSGYLLSPVLACPKVVVGPWICRGVPTVLGSSRWFAHKVERATGE